MAEIAKVRYRHDALIDAIIADPSARQRELARLFGYTEGWLSQVMSSDSFKVRLAARRAELIDPVLVASVEERLEGLAKQSIGVLVEKLDAAPSGELAIKALEISTRALGYGARDKGNVNIQNNYVVALPQKAANVQEWARDHSPRVALEAAGVEIEVDQPEVEVITIEEPK